MSTFENHKQYMQKNRKITSSLFLLIGEEEALKHDFIREAAIKYFGKEAEFRYFHQENPEDFQSFITFSRTTSMFTDAKAAVFTGVEKNIQISANMMLLDELLENISSDTMIFFISDSNSVPSSLKKFRTETVIFWKPFENELRDLIRKELSLRKISISPADISLILEYTGRDTGKINSAVERISAYAGSDPVDSMTIRTILNDEKQITVFEFIDMVFQKNHRCFAEMQKLADDGTHELVMLEFIRRELVKLEKYYISIRSGSGINEAIKAAGVNPKGSERFMKSADLFNSDKINSLFKEIYKTEMLLKTGNSGKNLHNPMTVLLTELIKN